LRSFGFPVYIDAMSALRSSSPFGIHTMPLADEEADWPREYIIAELHRRGMSLRALSFANGYSRNTLLDALDRSYPKAETIIAKALGLRPAKIWPTRYARRRKRNRDRKRMAKVS
jgi:Ner family transcriptional regulator